MEAQAIRSDDFARVQPHEQTLVFTGSETEGELRKMLLESRGMYQTMLIFTELRKKGVTP